jgi:hypothetical protein
LGELVVSSDGLADERTPRSLRLIGVMLGALADF